MTNAAANAIESLSLVSGAALVAVINVVFALPFLATRRRRVQWVAAFVIPFVVAYTTYWFPVWFGGGSATEYDAWSFLVYEAWSAAGFAGFASVLVAQYFIGKRTVSEI